MARFAFISRQIIYLMCVVSLTCFFSSTDAQADSLLLRKLLDEGNIADTFTTQSGYSIISSSYDHAEYFGVNPMLALDDKLYLGISTSLPAGNDGGMFGVYTPGDMVIGSHGVVAEQGVGTFTAFGDQIASPGVDPCCGDVAGDSGPGLYNHPWDWGNFYTFDGLTVQKYRNLPNVVHGWGSWFDEENDILYYAASGHEADTPIITEATLTGQLFSTTDGGANWNLVADRSDGVGTYRTYDVIGINNRLYVQFHDLSEDGSVDFSAPCGIARSDDQGESWRRLMGVETVCGVKLYEVDGDLVARGSAQQEIIRVDVNDMVSSYLIDFPIFSYHMLTQDRYGNVYIPTADGRVMLTRDFLTWHEIAYAGDSEKVFNTAYFWDDEETLYVSDWGEEANLWSVKIQNTDTQGLPDVLEISTVRDIYRFYSETYRSHFYTQSIQERDFLIAGDVNWAYEGVGLQGFNDARLGQLPVYRFYSETYRSHFYTISEVEKNFLIANDPNWAYEGVAWYAFDQAREGADALYRFYSQNYQSHFYTASVAERDEIIEKDANWSYEGVAYYIPAISTF